MPLGAHRRVGAPARPEGPWLRGRAKAAGRLVFILPSFPGSSSANIAILGSDQPQYVSPSNLTGAVP